MGHFSMEKSLNPGSVLGGNQHIADLVVKLSLDPTRYVRGSVGVNKPGTEGDKPSWY